MTSQTSPLNADGAADVATDERRSERIDLRVTQARPRSSARPRRQTVTEFLTDAAVKAATAAAEEERRVVLMNEVFDRFADELDQPEEVIPALAALIQRPGRLQMPE